MAEDSAPTPTPARVPLRTILALDALVLAVVLGLYLAYHLRRVLVLLAISTFLAVVLSPAVDLLHRKGIRRSLATSMVFFGGMASLAGLGYLFVRPIYRAGRHFADDLPSLVRQAQSGQGRIGELIRRYHVEKFVNDNAPKLSNALSHAGGPALALLQSLISGLAGLFLIAVLTFLILLEGPALSSAALRLLPAAQAGRVRRVARDVSRSVTGYVIGNLATSLIAGAVIYVTLLIVGVPFAFLFGLWVAMVDLLPLVGGLLAGVPTVAIAFLHSPEAGFVTLVVFLVYQQLENHILNPLIMSRTVRLNPLWVMLSVLVGADLGGIVGALLAIPAAGAIQVVARDVWDTRQGRLKPEPTVGEDGAAYQRDPAPTPDTNGKPGVELRHPDEAVVAQRADVEPVPGEDLGQAREGA
ncbi:MAG TPA: AI-2E family transporter [Acidimicrobiales bacterium]